MVKLLSYLDDVTWLTDELSSSCYLIAPHTCQSLHLSYYIEIINVSYPWIECFIRIMFTALYLYTVEILKLFVEYTNEWMPKMLLSEELS